MIKILRKILKVDKSEKTKIETEQPSNPNSFVCNVKLIRLRQFYDTKWEVMVTNQGTIEYVDLIRCDTESSLSLLEILKECKSIEDIKKLDERDKIYYD